MTNHINLTPFYEDVTNEIQVHSAVSVAMCVLLVCIHCSREAKWPLQNCLGTQSRTCGLSWLVPLFCPAQRNTEPIVRQYLKQTPFIHLPGDSHTCLGIPEQKNYGRERHQVDGAPIQAVSNACGVCRKFFNTSDQLHHLKEDTTLQGYCEDQMVNNVIHSAVELNEC